MNYNIYFFHQMLPGTFCLRFINDLLINFISIFKDVVEGIHFSRCYYLYNLKVYVHMCRLFLRDSHKQAVLFLHFSAIYIYIYRPQNIADTLSSPYPLLHLFSEHTQKYKH